MAGDSEVRILMTGLDPIKLLSVMSSSDYEQMTEEWLTSFLKDKSGKYIRVERIAGAGDKGRDVACTVNKESDMWDNYQCKHYESPLAPSNIWVEIGKLCFYSFNKEYSVPRKYYFVSPHGVGPSLRDLLKKPTELKKGLKENWDIYCKMKITKSKEVLLEGDFLKHIDGFDFSIFDYVSQQEFIDQMKETPYYQKHFGVLSKPRPLTECPDEIKDSELEYIRKILAAYSDYLRTHLDKSVELDSYPELKEHFNRQRRCFYETQTLKEFSRDIHDPKLEYFEKFMDEIYDGIINEIEDDAAHGYERLKKVLKRAEQIQVTNNPLIVDVKVKDRHGMCHHLANEREKVKWVK